MKKAAISTDILIIIIIAIVGMTIFIIFFTGKSAGLFGQFGQVAPSEAETARDACQIACNNAKLRTTCEDFSTVWCKKNVVYGETVYKCYDIVICEKVIDEDTCPDICKDLEEA